MKVYVLKPEDIDRLLALIDRDPKWGENGGSGDVLSPQEQAAHEKAHRFFNYQIRSWILSVTT